MINPYEPPKEERFRSPFLKRLVRAIARAREEYNAGMRREGLTTWQEINSWISLIAMLVILAALIVGGSLAIYYEIRLPVLVTPI
jgi:hypothetical protein